ARNIITKIKPSDISEHVALHQNCDVKLDLKPIAITTLHRELLHISSQSEHGTAYQLESLKKHLSDKDLFVQKIIEQDVAILSCIEAAKNQIIRDLKDLKKGQKVISAYKVPQFANQEEV
ncbi:MAG: hypothetical protein L6Q37_03700, partial [Bdellovibrionaceae bacterium]|nr:hypothetical protein [Pseudobdellovibrionaceae bacterium]